MKQELDSALCNDFPLLYCDRHFSMQHTCMCWGFPGNGWEPLIRDLSSKLEPLIKKIVDEIEVITNGNPKCICGEDRNSHENGIGKCLSIYKLPRKISFIKKIDSWGHFSIPGKIYDSKKIKDRIYVAYRRLKSKIAHKISNKIYQFMGFLCDKNICYVMTPSWCKEFKMSHPCASQVKEKFGTLRFYMTCATDEMYDLIHKAEELSSKTCEMCGAPGKPSEGGWIKTLCDVHAKSDAVDEE